MHKIIILLLLVLPFCTSLCSHAQNTEEDESTAEELAQQAREEHRAKLIEEMLPNTRALVFIDSLVVPKDNFLSQLRMSRDIGSYTAPENIISADLLDAATGDAAYVNSLASVAFFSVADSTGCVRMNATYRNAGEWTFPQPIDEFQGFQYQDYPFLHTDGTTLYFAASGEESIGGLDIFATRFNEETRQYVRPQNMGFPYNSTANDYLLAIDDELGLGVLVTDRRQPDDKVCIYWFIAEQRRETYDIDALSHDNENDDEDESEDENDPEAILRNFADIASIAATQVDREDEIVILRKQWNETIKAQARQSASNHKFVINDSKVYSSFEEFQNEEARDLAEKWVEASQELQKAEARQQQLRKSYAVDKSEKLTDTLHELEDKLPHLRTAVKQLEKAFRAAELGGNDKMK